MSWERKQDMSSGRKALAGESSLIHIQQGLSETICGASKVELKIWLWRRHLNRDSELMGSLGGVRGQR